MSSGYTKLEQELKELSYLASAQLLLDWDEQVNMPPSGGRVRAEVTAALAGIVHTKRTNPQFVQRLRRLHTAKGQDLTREQRAVIREAWRDIERERKLPLEFVTELSQTVSEAFMGWKEAREKKDFALFLPHFKKIVALKRQEAEYVGYKDSPYNALLDSFEPNFTVRKADAMFADLKQELVSLIRRIQALPKQIDTSVLQGDFPIETQTRLVTLIAERLGYDFSAGRIDTSIHPFESPVAAGDIRVTIRYDEHDLREALTSIIHETGHALYDQGMLEHNFGTPLGEAVSLGMHESQSRVWENLVGKSRAFWEYFYPIVQQYFPDELSQVDIDSFYRAINAVQPGFIRVDADEVSYNLHIIMRFELERALIEGDLQPEELPGAWNEKVWEYFGLEVPDDSLGVLQDVHWSNGTIGYFPTYTIGNLYSAQIFHAAMKDMPDLFDQFSSGSFSTFREWLREGIHVHGRMYGAEELIERVTGEEPTSRYFLEYLQKKYTELYDL